MKYIVPIAVAGVLLLQASGAIPMSSVGGPMTIALAFLAAALAVGIHEAWTKKRGVLGWILSIVVSIVGALVAAQLGEFLLLPLLMLMDVRGSLAATGGFAMSVGLAAMMLITLLGSWGALQLVNRWR